MDAYQIETEMVLPFLCMKVVTEDVLKIFISV